MLAHGEDKWISVTNQNQPNRETNWKFIEKTTTKSDEEKVEETCTSPKKEHTDNDPTESFLQPRHIYNLCSTILVSCLVSVVVFCSLSLSLSVSVYVSLRSIMIHDLYAPSCWSSIVVFNEYITLAVNLHISCSCLADRQFELRKRLSQPLVFLLLLFLPICLDCDSLLFCSIIFLHRTFVHRIHTHTTPINKSHIQFNV